MLIMIYFFYKEVNNTKKISNMTIFIEKEWAQVGV